MNSVIESMETDMQRLIREIHWLDWQLRAFEDKYSLLTDDFYRAMESGELADFDDGESECFHDFLEWHGLCKVRHKREQTYQNLLRLSSIPQRLRQVHVPAHA